MSNATLDALVARLRAGEEVTLWGPESGDPWGGYSRWGSIYRFDPETKQFHRRVVESTWHMGEGSPSDGRHMDEAELRRFLEPELLQQVDW